MNDSLTIIFFEDHFICSIQPNQKAWEVLKINGEEKNWLYFTVADGRIRNDLDVKASYEAGDEEAYGDFYTIILDPKITFKRYELELPSVNLLKESIEQVKLQYLERMRAFSPNINANFKIPLNLCFVPGLANEHETKIIISDFFENFGFKINSGPANLYFEALLLSLNKRQVIPNVGNLVIVETYFGNLNFNFIQYKNRVVNISTEVLEGKGRDNQITNLARIMLDEIKKRHKGSAGAIFNQPELYEKEIVSLYATAEEQIGKFKTYGTRKVLRVYIKLSDGSDGTVEIEKQNLDAMSGEFFSIIRRKFDDFVRDNKSFDNILLTGDLLSSDTFAQFFENSYGRTKVIRPFEDFTELLSKGIFNLNLDNFLVEPIPTRSLPASPSGKRTLPIRENGKIPTVGIDLGTTFSCISYIDENGKAVVIPNCENKPITPSVIFFDGKAGIVYVGDKANSRKITES